MIIWLLFLSVCYVFLILYENPKADNKQKLFILVGLILICTYFSTFRDGLGSDYTAYQSYCERKRLNIGSWLLMEPIPEFLYSICYNTKISAVLFFLVSSTIICFSSLWIYSKFKFFYLAAFLFLTYHNLYYQSFNVVRQFTAASIVLFATYYFVMKKKRLVFFLFVFLAFLWHKSAILSIPIYFLRCNNFNTGLWLFAVLLSWIAPVDYLFNVPIIGDLLYVLDFTEHISNEVAYSKTSLINIYFHIILIICMVGKEKIKVEDRRCFNITLKLSIISIIFCNISANSIPFAYRYGLFFAVFLPILFSYLPTILDKEIAKLIVFIPIIVLFFMVFAGKNNDRVFCPQRILPIESIYDKYYHPYENPDVQLIL